MELNPRPHGIIAKKSSLVREKKPYMKKSKEMPITRNRTGGDGDQREFDLETRVTTNGDRIISEIFHSCALNK